MNEALLVFQDTTRRGGLDEAQLEWADHDLKMSKDMPYKIVMLHPPPVKNGEVLSCLSPLVDGLKDFLRN